MSIALQLEKAQQSISSAETSISALPAVFKSGGTKAEDVELVEKRAPLSTVAKAMIYKINKRKGMPENEWDKLPLKARQELLSRGMVKHTGVSVVASGRAMEGLAGALAGAYLAEREDVCERPGRDVLAVLTRFPMRLVAWKMIKPKVRRVIAHCNWAIAKGNEMMLSPGGQFVLQSVSEDLEERTGQASLNVQGKGTIRRVGAKWYAEPNSTHWPGLKSRKFDDQGAAKYYLLRGKLMGEGVSAYNRGSRSISRSIYGRDDPASAGPPKPTPRSKDWGGKAAAKAEKWAVGYAAHIKKRGREMSAGDLADAIQREMSVGKNVAAEVAKKVLGEARGGWETRAGYQRADGKAKAEGLAEELEVALGRAEA